MPTITDNFGLTALAPGDDLSANGYAFMKDNIEKIDRLLAASTSHDHTATNTALTDPVSAPTLVLGSSQGNLPAGTTVRYRYTFVDQYGSETAASPEATVTTPSVVQKPGAPSATVATTGGTLLGGTYNYAVSAYVTSNTNETELGGRTNVSVSFSTATNEITLTLPSLPSGATGFNIYRRAPGEANWAYLASTVAATYDDDGSVTPNYSRQPQIRNLTNSTNEVNIELPVSLPANATWKIYRTYTSGNWQTSNLKHVTEETFTGSGIIIDNYDDLGLGTGLESAPEVSQIATVPGKISNDEVDFSYSDFSPSFTGLTTTDAVIVARYCRTGDKVHYYGSIAFGAATDVTGALTVNVPIAFANSSSLGKALFVDNSTGDVITGSCYSYLGLLVFAGEGGNVTASNPFDFTNGDSVRWNITYEAA